MPDQEALIGYFVHRREAAASWAALVQVTPEGDPVDFLYTDPLALSGFTRRLLGPRVDAYLVGRVLLAPLLAQAGRLSLLCFDDPAVLLRRLDVEVPVAVHAPAEAAHKGGAWVRETVAMNGADHTWWLAPRSADAAVDALRGAAEAMAPFGILEPFQQLRAAMVELKGEKA
ncbi:MAG TPA: hypothetical protein VF310_16765 [Vicinamibacteria bacterium]